jgi:hypothetical protein
MPTVQGMFLRVQDEQVTGTFDIDGVAYTLLATTTDAAVPEFAPASATLTYENRDSLRSGGESIPYSGHVGKTTFALAFSNGVKIEGNFDPPIDSAVTIMGQGEW